MCRVHWWVLYVGFLSLAVVVTLTANARSDDSAAAPAKAAAELKWLPFQPGSARPMNSVPVSQVIPAAAFQPITRSSSSRAALAPIGQVIPAAAFQTIPAEVLPDDPSPPVDNRAEAAPAKPAAPSKQPAAKAGTPSAVNSDVSSSPLYWQPAKPPSQPTQPSPPTAEGGAAISEELPPLSSASLEEKCKKPNEVLRSIITITDDIGPEQGDFPPECPVTEANAQPTGPFGARTAGSWKRTTFTWTAAATCNKPLYFEQPQVERYGHSAGPFLQPIVSAVHFFAAVPLLPYMMGVDPPLECQYSLGYYRPGACAPYMLDPFPISIRGALFEGAAIGGTVAILQP